jgi:hypothetical protein
LYHTFSPFLQDGKRGERSHALPKPFIVRPDQGGQGFGAQHGGYYFVKRLTLTFSLLCRLSCVNHGLSKIMQSLCTGFLNLFLLSRAAIVILVPVSFGKNNSASSLIISAFFIKSTFSSLPL